jgi:hypothetical protein
MARSAEEIPFMTKYDPPGSSEGTLDPLWSLPVGRSTSHEARASGPGKDDQD